jgi:hypothetical protein
MTQKAARYTSQWTQRAKVSPVSRSLADDIITGIKDETFTLESTGQRRVISQFTILVCLWARAMENGMDERDGGLAEEILYNQATKIRRYASKAYPLSEKQVRVIWNHTAKWATR